MSYSKLLIHEARIHFPKNIRGFFWFKKKNTWDVLTRLKSICQAYRAQVQAIKSDQVKFTPNKLQLMKQFGAIKQTNSINFNFSKLI